MKSVDKIESRVLPIAGATMHELTVTESILEIAIRNGRDSGADRITAIYLVIGELSSIIDDSVCFYWDIISEGTLAEGAALHFRRIPAEFTCQVCSYCFPFQIEYTCPKCRSLQIQITAGNEFYVEAIEVEEKDRAESLDKKIPSDELEEEALPGAAR